MNDFQTLVNGLTFEPHGTNQQAITINHGDFTGLKFAFGRVWFPDENKPVLSFEYDVLNGEVEPEFKKELHELLGGILAAILEKSINEGTTVYANGTGKVEVVEGDGSHYEPIVQQKPKFVPKIISDMYSERKIMIPDNYKVPQPEAGTKMSRNLLKGL